MSVLLVAILRLARPPVVKTGGAPLSSASGKIVAVAVVASALLLVLSLLEEDGIRDG